MHQKWLFVEDIFPKNQKGIVSDSPWHIFMEKWFIWHLIVFKRFRNQSCFLREETKPKAVEPEYILLSASFQFNYILSLLKFGEDFKCLWVLLLIAQEHDRIKDIIIDIAKFIQRRSEVLLRNFDRLSNKFTPVENNQSDFAHLL